MTGTFACYLAAAAVLWSREFEQAYAFLRTCKEEERLIIVLGKASQICTG